MTQWVRSLDLTTRTSLSPIRGGFAPGFVNYKKGCTRLAHCRWFSPASFNNKTGRHDIAKILLKVAFKHQKSINQINYFFVSPTLWIFCHFTKTVGRTNYAISAHHHQPCEFESRSRRGVLHTLCEKFVSDLQQVRSVVFSTNKMKVALNTITHTSSNKLLLMLELKLYVNFLWSFFTITAFQWETRYWWSLL